MKLIKNLFKFEHTRFFSWEFDGKGYKNVHLMSNGQIKTKKGDVYDLDDLVFSYYTPLGKLETKLDINSLRCLVTES